MRFSGQLRIFSHAILASVEDIFARDSRFTKDIFSLVVIFCKAEVASLRIFSHALGHIFLNARIAFL